MKLLLFTQLRVNGDSLIMNEKTAAHIDDDQVQKLFLLRDGKQLTEEYAFIAKPEDQRVEELSKILKETIN